MRSILSFGAMSVSGILFTALLISGQGAVQPIGQSPVGPYAQSSTPVVVPSAPAIGAISTPLIPDGLLLSNGAIVPRGSVSGAVELKATADKGKAVMEGACGNCHGVDLVTEQRYPKDAWTSVVQRMMERGADVKNEDVAPLIDYLTATYAVGPISTPLVPDGVLLSNGAILPRVNNLPVGTGRTIMERACSNCHSLDLIAEHHPKDGWTGIVRRMMDHGADVKPDDAGTLINYLTSTFGGKAGAPGAR